MEHYWAHGPMFVRELQELYPDPKPSFSTLSTQVHAEDSIITIVGVIRPTFQKGTCGNNKI